MEVKMGTINYARVIVATIVVGILYFIADGVIHGALLSGDYLSTMARLGIESREDPTAYAYFAAFDFGKAFVAVFFYAAARPRFGPGIKTAICAGLFTWLAVEALPAIASMPLPFLDKPHYLKLMALEIVPITLGAILGAWIYREPTSA